MSSRATLWTVPRAQNVPGEGWPPKAAGDELHYKSSGRLRGTYRVPRACCVLPRMTLGDTNPWCRHGHYPHSKVRKPEAPEVPKLAPGHVEIVHGKTRLGTRVRSALSPWLLPPCPASYRPPYLRTTLLWAPSPGLPLLRCLALPQAHPGEWKHPPLPHHETSVLFARSRGRPGL